MSPKQKGAPRLGLGQDDPNFVAGKNEGTSTNVAMKAMEKYDRCHGIWSIVESLIVHEKVIQSTSRLGMPRSATRTYSKDPEIPL